MPKLETRNAVASRRIDIVIMLGLTAGAVLGMAGTFADSPHLRGLAWTIDAVGLVVATSLLALRFFRQGNDTVAAGFLVYALGESVMMIGNASGLQGSVPSFQAGTALWAAGLLLVSMPKVFAFGTRAAGLVSAVLFGLVSLRIVLGEQLVPTAKPLPNFAYPFLVLTFAGWIWHVAKRKS
jgi:hypothetical protein